MYLVVKYSSSLTVHYRFDLYQTDNPIHSVMVLLATVTQAVCW